MDIKGIVYLDRDSIRIGPPFNNWTIGIHIEHPWSSCVLEYNAPRRIYLNLGQLGYVTIGLPARDLNGWRIETGQTWSPTGGMTDKWKPVAYRPPRWSTCKAVVREQVGRSDRTRQEICGALRWHKGPHRDPDSWRSASSPVTHA